MAAPSFAPAPRTGAPSAVVGARARPGLGPVETFVLVQIACQVLLLLPGIGPARVVVRSAAIGLSLLLLVLLRRDPVTTHPATRAAGWVALVLVVSVLNPGFNSFPSALAQLAMYLAILAPLRWVPRADVGPRVLDRVLTLLWAFHTASALLGVLQVYFPGQLQPSLSIVYAGDPDRLESFMITLADGSDVLRPMGLTDVPGGAAMAGFYAALLGLTFFATKRASSSALRVAAMASIVIGLFCMYLSQVRAVLVIAAVCAAAFVGLMAWRRRFGELSVVALVLGLGILLAFSWAVAVGGDAVTGRLSTLVAQDPGEVYYKSRGRFLEHTFNVLLPEYPLGAGMGRWGMMSSYFGDRLNRESPPLWVEIQWTGWLLDGGVVLIAAYLAALGLALRTAWRLATRLDPEDALWIPAVFLVAYDLGALALTFSYPVFHSQTGLEFWLLNALVCVTYAVRQRERQRSGRAT